MTDFGVYSGQQTPIWLLPGNGGGSDNRNGFGDTDGSVDFGGFNMPDVNMADIGVGFGLAGTIAGLTGFGLPAAIGLNALGSAISKTSDDETTFSSDVQAVANPGAAIAEALGLDGLASALSDPIGAVSGLAESIGNALSGKSEDSPPTGETAGATNNADTGSEAANSANGQGETGDAAGAGKGEGKGDAAGSDGAGNGDAGGNGSGDGGGE